MHIDGVAARQFVAELADRLEERQRLDVADRAADFAQDKISAGGVVQHERLDRVGHMRNDLHRGAEIIAAPFAFDDARIDLAGGDVVGLRGRHAGEALIVAEIEIGLRAVVSDEDFAVLIGRHRAGIDVEVRVELAQANLVAARLKERA